MKKIIIIILSILIIPNITYATINNNYDVAKGYAGVYKNSLKNFDNYILKNESDFEIPFVYNNENLSVNKDYINAGLLNRYEFLITRIDGQSYLQTGSNYFTMTESGSKVYMINNKSEDNTKLVEKTENSALRVTEFLKEKITVKGTGTFDNPWIII